MVPFFFAKTKKARAYACTARARPSSAPNAKAANRKIPTDRASNVPTASVRVAKSMPGVRTICSLPPMDFFVAAPIKKRFTLTIFKL
jgi:hypothetical protein